MNKNAEAARRWRKRHPEAAAAKSAAWKRDNPDKVLAQNKRWRDATAKIVFAYYGESCACCGTTSNLSIDHVDGNGAEHRQDLSGDRRQFASHRFRRWLIANGLPDGYQTLCVPCNRSKGNGPRCLLAHSILPITSPLLDLLTAGTTIQEVADALGITFWAARRRLEQLRDAGAVRLEGKRHQARWLVA